MEAIKEIEEKAITGPRKKDSCVTFSVGSGISMRKKDVLKSESFKDVKVIREHRDSTNRGMSTQNIYKVKDILNSKK